MKLVRLMFCSLLAGALASCDPPKPPPPTTQPAKPMVLVVPGLGDGQTASVVLRLREAFGDKINVVDFSTGKNGYRADIAKYAAENAHSKLMVVAHSYGTDKTAQSWASMGDLSLVVLLDPVPEKLFGEYTVPPNVHRCIVITGDYSGLFRAKINGSYEEFKVHREHSAMAHDAQTLALIESAIREVL